MGNRMMRYSYNNKPEQSAELEAALDEHFRGAGEGIEAPPLAKVCRGPLSALDNRRASSPPTPIKIKECE